MELRGNKMNNEEAIATSTESDINFRPVPNRQYFATIPIIFSHR